MVRVSKVGSAMARKASVMVRVRTIYPIRVIAPTPIVTIVIWAIPRVIPERIPRVVVRRCSQNHRRGVPAIIHNFAFAIAAHHVIVCSVILVQTFRVGVVVIRHCDERIVRHSCRRTADHNRAIHHCDILAFLRLQYQSFLNLTVRSHHLDSVQIIVGTLHRGVQHHHRIAGCVVLYQVLRLQQHTTRLCGLRLLRLGFLLSPARANRCSLVRRTINIIVSTCACRKHKAKRHYRPNSV